MPTTKPPHGGHRQRILAKLEKDSLIIYSKLLTDLPLENIKVAFEMLTTQTKFFPTVAEIREIAERLSWDIEYREMHMGK